MPSPRRRRQAQDHIGLVRLGRGGVQAFPAIPAHGHSFRHRTRSAGLGLTNRAILDAPAACAKQRQGTTRQRPARTKFQHPERPILRPRLRQCAKPSQDWLSQSLHGPTHGGRRWRHKRLTTQGRDHLLARPRQPGQIKRKPWLFRQYSAPDRLGRRQGLVFNNAPTLSQGFRSAGQRQHAP